MSRPTHVLNAANPGSDLAGQVSAAFASAALLYNDIDNTLAADYYQRAIQLRDFAWAHQGKHNDNVADGGDPGGAGHPYRSSHFHDEMVYASLWVAKASQVRVRNRRLAYFELAYHNTPLTHYIF